MKCPRCGYENPPDVARCTACDARLPAVSAPRPEIVPRERPIQPRRSLERIAEPGTPVVHVPIPPPEPESLSSPLPTLRQRLPVVLGIRPRLAGLVISRQARWDTPPRELGRPILRLALLLLVLPLVLGACSALALTLVTAALAAVCLGMEGFLLCTVPALGVLLALWGLSRRPAPDEAPVLEMRLEDASVSPPRQVNVEMIGARHGGDVRAGDEVELWGKWTRGGTFRAWRARIVRAGDQPIRAEVRAARPYSLPVALAALLVAVLVNAAVIWLLWPR